MTAAASTLTTRQLFDGETAHGEGWLRVENGQVVGWGVGKLPHADQTPEEHACVLPALVDAHCHVTGYLEELAGDPFLPHRETLGLLCEAGVGAVRDLGNHAEAPESIRRLDGSQPPLLVHAGPSLDEPPGQSVICRLVRDEGEVHEAVARSAAEGATWVKAHAGLSTNLLRAAVEAAAELGLKVAHRPGRADALTAIRLGVATLEHLPLCLPTDDGEDDLPREMSATTVRRWAAPSADERAQRLVEALAASPVALVPLLHAWRRRTVLEEAVSEPRLDRLLPILPYHRFLLEMRGHAGLAFGRRYARRYLGFPDLRGGARRELEAGWELLGRTLAGLHDAGCRLAAGSDAAGLAVVPGFGLHDELMLWERAGIPRLAALRAATGGGAAALGLSGAGRLNEGTGGVLALRTDPLAAVGLGAALARPTWISRPNMSVLEPAL